MYVYVEGPFCDPQPHPHFSQSQRCFMLKKNLALGTQCMGAKIFLAN